MSRRRFVCFICFLAPACWLGFSYFLHNKKAWRWHLVFFFWVTYLFAAIYLISFLFTLRPPLLFLVFFFWEKKMVVLQPHASLDTSHTHTYISERETLFAIDSNTYKKKKVKSKWILSSLFFFSFFFPHINKQSLFLLVLFFSFFFFYFCVPCTTHTEQKALRWSFFHPHIQRRTFIVPSSFFFFLWSVIFLET